MIITSETYERMPEHLRELFDKLPNPGSAEVVALFPDSAGAAVPVRGSEPSQRTTNVYGQYERVPGAFYGDAGSAARFFYCAKASRSERNAGCGDLYWEQWSDTLRPISRERWAMLPKRLRAHGNTHPTVKPLALMRYLARLTQTPTHGTVLDPFMGSGSTGCAAVLEGRGFVGIDNDPVFCMIAEHRIHYYEGRSE